MRSNFYRMFFRKSRPNTARRQHNSVGSAGQIEFEDMVRSPQGFEVGTGVTRIYSSIMNRNWQGVMILLARFPEEANAAIEYEFWDGTKTTFTLLHLACVNNPTAPVVSKLISLHREAIVMECSRFGNLPLHYACRFQANKDVVVLLASCNRETITVGNRNNNNALHLLVSSRQPHACHHASFMLGLSPSAILASNFDNETPLERLIRLNRANGGSLRRVLEFALEHSAELMNEESDRHVPTLQRAHTIREESTDETSSALEHSEVNEDNPLVIERAYSTPRQTNARDFYQEHYTQPRRLSSTSLNTQNNQCPVGSSAYEDTLSATLEQKPTNHSAKQCVVCWDADAVYALVPCGHICFCAGCSTKDAMIKIKYKCPECRAKTREVLRIYGKVLAE